MVNRDRRPRGMRTRRERNTALREQRARARMNECMNTFCKALEHAGKSREEIARLSGIYAERLDRTRKDFWS